MSNDLNLCSFIGRLGKDVDTRYMSNGEAVASFSIAVGSQWKDKNSGEKKESTEWVSISAFGKLAEICSEYLTKGSQVFISGRMKTEKYTDKAGVEKYSTKIIADRMQMLGSRSEAGTESAPHHEAKPGLDDKPKGDFDDFADDIPF